MDRRSDYQAWRASEAPFPDPIRPPIPPELPASPDPPDIPLSPVPEPSPEEPMAQHAGPRPSDAALCLG